VKQRERGQRRTKDNRTMGRGGIVRRDNEFKGNAMKRT